MFLALFWAYVGQPDSHIGWVKLMTIASFNPTNPRTNLWNFGENCSAFGGGWKTQFFWVSNFFERFFLMHFILNLFEKENIFSNYKLSSWNRNVHNKYIILKRICSKEIPFFPKVILHDCALITHYDCPNTPLWQIQI